ncbi:MAG: hypothetical protein R3C56_39820 [Pirellulaceae bacterium]
MTSRLQWRLSQQAIELPAFWSLPRFCIACMTLDTSPTGSSVVIAATFTAEPIAPPPFVVVALVRIIGQLAFCSL